MKIRIGRLFFGALISLLSLFAFAAQATAQGPIFNQFSRSPKLRGNTGKTHTANIADVASAYGYQVLYSFCSVGGASCTDGNEPIAGLIQDAAGNLYGTTVAGGANNSGTVFKLDTMGQETVLYSFCSVGGASCTDGNEPFAGLIQDAAGNLYGTTVAGGANNSGTVFKLDTTGQETVLYSFSPCSASSCPSGENPYAGLIQDAAGNLYGTTGGSANSAGTVFKLHTTGQETVLYSFCSESNCTDGANPSAGLIQDAAGNLYGTTVAGGANSPEGFGGGTVFKLDNTGQTVLYSFCSVGGANCTDGEYPYAGLIQDAAGNLYGTTSQGGTHGGGTVFKLDNTGQETVLYTFCSVGGANCTDGEYPYAGLIQDAAGNLYGTTSQGGTHGGGTVFKLDNTGQETVLYTFCSVGGANCTDGDSPRAGLIQDAAGNLYGTAFFGGAHGGGTVFKLSPLPTPTVTVTPSSSSITTEQALNVTVTVSGGSGNPTPTGTVKLTSGNYTSAATTLSGGSATINIPAGSLAVGTDTLTATYSGDSNYSTATGATSVTVTLPTPTVTVTPSSSSITTEQALNVTVTISGGSGNPTPTGTVKLTSGSYTSAATTLSGGTATINIPAGSLAVGTDTLTATYSGDSNYSPASGTNSVTVTPVSPSFTVGGTAVSVSPGTTNGNTSTITVTPSGGFTGNVTLTATITSSPTGAQDPPTLSFGSTSPVDITGASAGTATLTISTTAATSGALAYPVRPGVRWYTAGSAGMALALVFGMGIPARRRNWRTRLGLLVFLMALTGGLLACGSGGSSGGGGGGNPGTTAGTYTVTVTGTSGNTTAKGTVTLTVQ